MNRTGTLPAKWGESSGFAGVIEIAPQAARQCSRRGRSTAGTGHDVCSWRFVPHTPRHTSRRALGCAVAARRLLPLPCKHVSRSRRPLRSGRKLPPLQGGLVREAAVGRGRPECGFAEIKGAPSSPRSKERAEGLAFWWIGSRGLRRRATNHPGHGTVTARAPVASSLRRDPPPCRVPPKSAAPCSGAVAPHIERARPKPRDRSIVVASERTRAHHERTTDQNQGTGQ